MKLRLSSIISLLAVVLLKNNVVSSESFKAWVDALSSGRKDEEQKRGRVFRLYSLLDWQTSGNNVSIAYFKTEVVLDLIQLRSALKLHLDKDMPFPLATDEAQSMLEELLCKIRCLGIKAPRFVVDAIE